eukprot:GHRQ01028025.1.p1 GENE.GHRQ01028025.1~~GHRQ01028025.1.p1  ORF type:complete len:125 (-),score=39.02 GHRQ01028025.1:730-1104(-)
MHKQCCSTLHAGRSSSTATRCTAQGAAAATRSCATSKQRLGGAVRAGVDDVPRQTEVGSNAVAAAAADAQQAANAAAVRQAYKSGKLAFGFSAGGLLFPVSCLCMHIRQTCRHCTHLPHSQHHQ